MMLRCAFNAIAIFLQSVEIGKEIENMSSLVWGKFSFRLNYIFHKTFLQWKVQLTCFVLIDEEESIFSFD
jgi:hypothetical protein